MNTVNGIGWRRKVSDLLLILGVLLLVCVGLSQVKIALAGQEISNQPFLISNLELRLPLPDLPVETSPSFVPRLQPSIEIGVEPPNETGIVPSPETGILPTPETGIVPSPETGMLPSPETGIEPPIETEIKPSDAENPEPSVVSGLQPSGAPDPVSPADYRITAFLPLITNSDHAVSEPQAPITTTEIAGVPWKGPSAGKIIRLVIPSLRIDRAVVPVGLRRDASRHLTWNTDVLFSTNNRPDLVGQTVTSANPGEGGNIILIGHNYNNGWIFPNGVFVSLLKLRSGSQVIVYTEDGEEFKYLVKQVKKVPWREQNNAELEKHQKFLLPTGQEQLTLITCGGANFGVWSARVYVVALPIPKTASN